MPKADKKRGEVNSPKQHSNYLLGLGAGSGIALVTLLTVFL